MSVESTTPLSFTVASSSTLNAVDVTNGQIVALNDAHGLYYDMNNVRHKVATDPDRVKLSYLGTVIRFGMDGNGNYGYYDDSDVFHKWRNPQGDASQDDVFVGTTFSNSDSDNLIGTLTTYSSRDLGDFPGSNLGTYTSNGTHITPVSGDGSTLSRFASKYVRAGKKGSTFSVNVPSEADPTKLTTYSGVMSVNPRSDDGGYTNYMSISPPTGKTGMTTVSLCAPQLPLNTTFSGETMSTANNVYDGDTNVGSKYNVMVLFAYSGFVSSEQTYLMNTSNMGNATDGDVQAGKTYTSSSGVQRIGTWKTYSHQLTLGGKKVNYITLPSDVNMYTNKVGYGWLDRNDFFYTTRYYKTSGLNTNGTIADGVNGYFDDESEVKVISVTARYVTIFIKYESEGSGWDWGCIWKGSHSGYTAKDNYSSSFTGKLGDRGIKYRTYMFDTDSDSILSSDKNFTVGWRSDSGVHNAYGMYVTIIQNANQPYRNPYYTLKLQGVGLYASYDPRRNGTGVPIKIDSFPSLGSSGVKYIYHNYNPSGASATDRRTVRLGDNLYLRFDASYTSTNGSIYVSYSQDDDAYYRVSDLTIDKTAAGITLVLIPESTMSLLVMYMWCTGINVYSLCRMRRIFVKWLIAEDIYQTPSTYSGHLFETGELSLGAARTSRSSPAVAGTQWEEAYILSPAVPRFEGSSYNFYQHHYSYNYAAGSLAPTYMGTCGSTSSAIGSQVPDVFSQTGHDALTNITGDDVCKGSSLYGRHSILPYIGCHFFHSDNTNYLSSNPYGLADGYSPTADAVSGIIYPVTYMFGRIQQYAIVISTEYKNPLYLRYSTYETSNRGFQLFIYNSTNYEQDRPASGSNISFSSTKYSAHIYDLSSIGGDIVIEQSTFSKMIYSSDKYGTGGVIFKTSDTSYDGIAEVQHIFAYDNVLIICTSTKAFGFYVNIDELLRNSGSSAVWPFYFIGSCAVQRTQTAEQLSAYTSDLRYMFQSRLREVSGPHMYDITFCESNN